MDDLKTDGTNWAQAFRVSLTRARTEAKRAGSRTLEAEHLILALAAEHGSAPARLLAETGLDHDAAREALEACNWAIDQVLKRLKTS